MKDLKEFINEKLSWDYESKDLTPRQIYDYAVDMWKENPKQIDEIIEFLKDNKFKLAKKIIVAVTPTKTHIEETYTKDKTLNPPKIVLKVDTFYRKIIEIEGVGLNRNR